MLSLCFRWNWVNSELSPSPAFSKWHQCSGTRVGHLVQAVLSPIQLSTSWDVTHPVWPLAFGFAPCCHHWRCQGYHLVGGLQSSLLQGACIMTIDTSGLSFQLFCTVLEASDTGLLSHAIPGWAKGIMSWFGCLSLSPPQEWALLYCSYTRGHCIILGIPAQSPHLGRDYSQIPKYFWGFCCCLPL